MSPRAPYSGIGWPPGSSSRSDTIGNCTVVLASAARAGRSSWATVPAAMARRYFGTDGVRGIVGEFLTVDIVERLGRAATLWSGRGRVFVGRDTRGSGPELEEAFARGVASAGGSAVLGGVLP